MPGSPVQKRGPLKERCPHPVTFRTYILVSPVKELLPRPLQRSPFRETEREREREFIHLAPFIHLKVPSRRTLPQAPQSGAPMRRDGSLQGLSTYLSGSSVKEPYLQVPFTELPE